MTTTVRCLSGISWEGSNNLLASSTVLFLDADDGASGNCVGGVLDYVEPGNENFQEDDMYPCSEEWRIFNLQGDRESALNGRAIQLPSVRPILTHYVIFQRSGSTNVN